MPAKTHGCPCTWKRGREGQGHRDIQKDLNFEARTFPEHQRHLLSEGEVGDVNPTEAMFTRLGNCRMEHGRQGNARAWNGFRKTTVFVE